MTTLRFRPEAETDLGEARAWYDEQRDGLGSELLRRLMCWFGGSARRQRSSVRPCQTRRALVRRFPYAVFFVEGADATIVLGVFHQAVDPARRKTRTH